MYGDSRKDIHQANLNTKCARCYHKVRDHYMTFDGKRGCSYYEPIMGDHGPCTCMGLAYEAEYAPPGMTQEYHGPG